MGSNCSSIGLKLVLHNLDVPKDIILNIPDVPTDIDAADMLNESMLQRVEQYSDAGAVMTINSGGSINAYTDEELNSAVASIAAYKSVWGDDGSICVNNAIKFGLKHMPGVTLSSDDIIDTNGNKIISWTN